MDEKQAKFEFVMDHRNELLQAITAQCRSKKVDQLKNKLSKFVDENSAGLKPCEVACALQIVTDGALTLNFDFRPGREKQ